MPSQWGTKKLQNDLGTRAAMRAMMEGIRGKLIEIAAPLLGFAPDFVPEILDWKVLRDVENLVPRGEVLTLDDGCGRVGAVGLPLTTGTSTSIALVAPFPRFDYTTASTVPVHLMAVTASSGTDVGAVYHYDTTTWTALVGPGVSTASTPDYLWDWALYPPGTTDEGRTTAVAESLFVFTNNVEDVYCYPDATADTTHYGKLTTHTAFGATFKAATVCNHNDRLVFGNTSENSQRHHLRIRWTVIADGADFFGVGAGALDLNEFSREVIRVLPCGDVVVAYARDGIAFLRRTGNYNQPYQVEYITKTRGLLGPRLVCSIGKGRHFFVSDDGGFWVLASNGDIEELGTVKSGSGYSTWKWKEWFFSSLNTYSRDRATVAYDPVRRGVRIAWPTGTASDVSGGFPNKTAFYEIENDRLWPGEWGVSTPTYIESCPVQALQPGETWDSGSSGSWDSWDGVWDSEAAGGIYGTPIFGTSAGIILQISRAVTTRDGAVPYWLLAGAIHNLGSFEEWKGADTLWTEFLDVGNQTWAQGFAVANGTVPGLTQVNITGEDPGYRRVTHTNHHLSSSHLGYFLVGQGNVKLTALKVFLIGGVGGRVIGPYTGA